MRIPRFHKSFRSWLGAGIALVAIAVVLVWQVRLLGNIRVDDAYITFSFSKNLALGNGPVYSHGVRVEGYSNFLWMILVAIPLVVHHSLDPYVIARVLTIPFTVLLGWSIYSLVRLQPMGVRLPPFLAWIGILFICFDSDLIFAGLCGLETLPFVALLTAGVASYLHQRAGSVRAKQLTVPCLVALALMRIDGFIPFGGILAWEFVSSIRAKRFRVASFLHWCGPGVAVYLLWFAWRWGYYGLPLPTTYYAKALIPVALPNRGWEYARDFWLSTGLFAFFPFALLALAGRNRKQAVLLSAFIVLHSAYVIKVGGDWMPFWRFFTPVVPFVSVLVVWGIAEAVRRSSRLGWMGRGAAAGAALASAIWMGRRMDGHHIETDVERDKMNMVAIMAPVIDNNFLPMAHLMNHVVRPGQRLVSDYAGVMAYFTNAEVIDMWGLCNKKIALRGTTKGVNPIWGRTCPSCYAEFDPDYFHVMSVGKNNAFADKRAVLNAVWQSNTIGRYVDFRQFVVGRATNTRSGIAVFFLERRRPGSVFATRKPTHDVRIDYPFGIES